MRRGLGCARIEKWFTWLFESSWRSTCPAAAALAAAELFAAADAQVGRSSRLESRPRPRFSRKETGFECWQPRTAAIVQHHQYSQSEQRHRHLRSGRGSIYLFEGALEAQRRRQHAQVLVQRLPPCSFERTLPPHPGRTGKIPCEVLFTSNRVYDRAIRFIVQVSYASMHMASHFKVKRSFNGLRVAQAIQWDG